MIEINLLPEELKLKAKASQKEQNLARALYVLPVLVGILLLVHLWLALALIFKSYQLNSLSAKWKALQPQRQALEEEKMQYDSLSQDGRIARQLWLSGMAWAPKLNQLSLDTIPGIWFNELDFSSKECVLKGSAISLEKEEMALINRFLDNLKKDSLFLKDFSGLELSGVQIRSVGGYNVVDFTVSFKPKAVGAGK